MKISKVVDNLQAIMGTVSVLAEKYPRNRFAGGAGVAQAEKQIPWICRTLNEASDALNSGQDPFGNPITVAQVVSGLEQLVAYVRNASYGTLMEMVYPGIDKPLQKCMDKLERIIAKIM